MNDTLKTILSHRSIRKFKETPIAPELLEQILKAACAGSTLGNMQLFSIIVSEDKALMQKIADAHFNQPIATNAPLMLTFCADTHRFNKFCEYRETETTAYNNLQCYQWAVTDALIAAQNACVAAESLGLGLCWLGTITYNCPRFIEHFQLPKNVLPVACIAFGYPDENPGLTQKLPLEALIHKETYHDYNEQTINQLYEEKEKSPETVALLKENNLDNLAKIFTECRYVKKDNEFFAQVLAQALEQQDFMR
ncbi:MAG: nitroreductase family protein [Bacteroidales bacterium]|nr:nitroreductase family protein [Bacteroidales bacterium]